jgi:Protein of unknown function (DUF2865)
MVETVIAHVLRRLGPAALAFSAALLSASAQQYPQFPGGGPYSGAAPAPPGGQQRNPVCIRLEGQLTALDRGNYDPARANEIKRAEDLAGRQQGELDRLTAQGRYMGCEGRGFFSLFSGQPAQCGPLNNQIQQARANLDRTLGDLQRLQGNTADREGQRRALLVSLGQNDCGPQYRAYANRGGGGFFENLFGPGSIINPDPPQAALADTYKTICVRTCDGYFFPISYSTIPGKFADDEKLCQRLCPATEAALYSYRNPGEDVSQAVSSSGRTYSELPNAFSYRKALSPACSCKLTNQTWAEALKQLDDTTIERGDVVVTEERARQLSQPTDAQGRPLRTPAAGAARPGAANAKGAPAAANATPDDQSETEPGKRKVRTVGPTFMPSR